MLREARIEVTRDPIWNMEPNSVRYSILSVVVAAKSILIRTGSNLGRREERGKLRNDGVAEVVSETADKGDRQGVSGR